MRRIVLVTTLAALLVLAGCVGMGDSNGGASPALGGGDGASASGDVGYAVGGAQDVNDFRNNVEEGYVPQPESLTAEGLFHDYYFDTGQDQACDATFCPSYSRAVTTDPLSDEREQYMTVGLNSGLSAADFERKPLNLVLVVDTSGSMSSQFNAYYYDNGTKTQPESTESKMAAARDAVTTLTGHLTDDDRIGIVAYDSSARTIVEMQNVGEADMDAVQEQIAGMHAGGGTNLDAGMQIAEEMVRPYRNGDQTERETRIIYVTDAMPNLGQTDDDPLQTRLEEQADGGVYTTFVGVGIDFNARFVESVNEVRGANHYVVRSPSEFEDRMVDGFDYMVTPMVFDLSLELESDAYEIDAVYGSPNQDATDGELVSVNTLFPSRTTDGKTEGGVVLVKLERTDDGGDTDGAQGDTDGDTAPVTLRASYETRDGERHETERTVQFADHDAPYYETTGVRKAVALSRYADLVRNWMAYERAKAGDGSVDAPSEGIDHRTLGEWEQQSVDLQVTDPYPARFKAFREYFAAEADALGDEDLQQELAILDALIAAGTDDGDATNESDATDSTTSDETTSTTSDETDSSSVLVADPAIGGIGLENGASPSASSGGALGPVEEYARISS